VLDLIFGAKSAAATAISDIKVLSDNIGPKIKLEMDRVLG